MKLRIIIVVLSLLTILVSTVGSYIYYSSLNKSIVKQIQALDKSELAGLDRHISGFIDSSHIVTKRLAENNSIRQALTHQQPLSEDAEANLVLDNFRDATNSSVVYLMNKDGVTIASSNRHSPDSFVGKNYAFRPYFKQAITGKHFAYLALGKTSRKRGIYCSHPIYGSATENPVGVVIIKYPVHIIRDEFTAGNFSGEIVLTSPQGVIFMSTVQDILYKTLWKLSPESIGEILASGQFGAGPFEWSGLKKTGDHKIVDTSGNLFDVHQKGISALPGWSLSLMHNHESMKHNIYGSVIQTWRYILLLLIVFVGVTVLILYRIGSENITLRRQAEQKKEQLIVKLQKALDEIKTLQGIIPICMYCKKIKGDKDVWNKLEDYIEKHSDADFSHGICPDCLKIQKEEVKRIKDDHGL